MGEDTMGRDDAERRAAVRLRAQAMLAQQSREELIETALALQDKKMAMRSEIDRLRRVITKQRAWGRLSLSFIASGVLFAVILIEGVQHLWTVPLVLIESVFGGFVAGFLLVAAQRTIRKHIYEKFDYSKTAQAASYITLFVMSAAVVIIVWLIKTMWF